MNKAEIRAAILLMCDDEKLSFSEAAQRLTDRLERPVSRQYVYGVYTSAKRSGHRADTEELLKYEIIRIMTMGFSKKATTKILINLGYSLTYDKTLELTSRDWEVEEISKQNFNEMVNTAIEIMRGDLLGGDAVTSVEIALTYNEIVPSKKVLTSVMCAAYEHLIEEQVKEMAKTVYQINNSMPLARKLGKKFGIVVMPTDVK